MFDTHQAHLSRIPRDAGIDAALEILTQTGAIVIDNAAPRTLIERVGEELRPWFDRAYAANGPFLGRQTKRFSGVLAKAPSSADLVGCDFIVELAERALKGPDPHQPRCDKIQLNLTHAIGVEPGQRAQVLHRDEVMFPFEHGYEVMVNVMWPMEDWSAEMGATRLVPHSQDWPRTRLAQSHEIAVADAPAGAAIMWLGSIVHGAGANSSMRTRHGLAFSYALGWLGQAERLLLSTPPDLARSLPERVQRLIGYQMHLPNLGWIEERDPIEWLRGEFEDLAPAEDNLTEIQEALVKWRLDAESETA